MSASVKVFGNEVAHRHWEGRKEILERIRKLNPISKLHNLMNGEENQFSYASQYIDSTHTIPLGVGLPLNLMAQGQVVAEIRGHMRTDLKSIFSSGKGEIMWKVHPSAAVIFNGAMSVDAIAVKSMSCCIFISSAGSSLYQMFTFSRSNVGDNFTQFREHFW